MMPEPLARCMEAAREQVDAALDGFLPRPEGPASRLAEAMRYSVFAGGKRLRPALVLLAADLCGGRRELALPPACAIELVHTYSLIHDDLPAMDNDDLRRGRPSCHRAFDEATAILAGDALLTLAFEVLVRPPCEGHAAALVAELARAAGAAGMAAGQMCDMSLTGTEPTAEAVDFIHRHKTAALMSAALRLGAIVADAPDAARARLGRFGELLGLAFQITDDALDVEVPSELLGKTAGKDASEGKITYPAVFGLAESRRRAAELTEQAIAELEPFGPSADLLRDLARWLASRRS
ncbi:MAG: polyprenyl synthetase family protein [Planctomycetes bacterium]|nr:polyprenyl synthetase family protein [Planctomycetota bacterium]